MKKLAIFFCLMSVNIFSNNDYRIIHDKPSANWREASPLGNGRIGAMVEGGAVSEVIHLNEDTLWSGEPQPHHDGTHCREALPKVRSLLFKGWHSSATKLGMKTMLGDYNQAYQPAGQLKIRHNCEDAVSVTSYYRELDLNSAVSVTEFFLNGKKYKREVFVSYPDQIMVVRISTEDSSGIDFDLKLDSPHISVSSFEQGNTLVLRGRAPVHADPHYIGDKIVYDSSSNPEGMRYTVASVVDSPGAVVSTKAEGWYNIVSQGDVVIRLALRTSFNGFDKSPSREGTDDYRMALADLQNSEKSYNVLKDRHVRDYSSIFSRVEIDLGSGKKSGLPVSARVGENYEAGKDPDLDELFYQFGRYLLIASSREGSQPANLQGIWSYKRNPSWSSNWTINCNTQFNYIGSGAAGLVELNEPYLRMMEEASVDGAKVAETWYGTGGWVAHHNLDLWRAAMPVDGNVLWATFPVAGSWCVVELYDNWKFSNDPATLKRVNKLQEGSVQFWLENLVRHPKSGKYVSSPDVYFENVATKCLGTKVTLCSGPVSSTILIRQLFNDYIESSKLLALNNSEKISEIKAMLLKMADLEIKKNGEIRQWHDDFKGNWKETDPTQLLVMVGAIYSSQIHPELSPNFSRALLAMLKKRGNGLDGQASWRAAFPANTYARLGQGDLCKKVIDATYRKWINPNLTARFIQADWEIDGNLGLMGAVNECLLQSQTGEIILLPALPAQWANRGSVKGLKARGGYTLDFTWKDGEVTDWNILGNEFANEKVTIRVNGEKIIASIK
jgi:alpha-L-fucosidase 2